MTRRIAVLAALAAILLGATPALAGEPDPGHADLFHHDPGDARIVLDWHFANAGYPLWFRSSIESELDTWWADRTANNSGVPRFDNGGDNAGGGTIVYTAAAATRSARAEAVGAGAAEIEGVDVALMTIGEAQTRWDDLNRRRDHLHVREPSSSSGGAARCSSSTSRRPTCRPRCC